MRNESGEDESSTSKRLDSQCVWAHLDIFSFSSANKTNMKI